MPAALVALITALAYALHQDFWLWRRARPLVMGFLPAGRAIGPVVLLLSLFGTNMTAFSILGTRLWALELVEGYAPVWLAAILGAAVLGLLPVVPMTLISALLMFVVSSVTQASRPAPATLLRYTV